MQKIIEDYFTRNDDDEYDGHIFGSKKLPLRFMSPWAAS